MKKKILSVLIIITIFVFIIIIYRNTSLWKIVKGYRLFGNEKCTETHSNNKSTGLSNGAWIHEYEGGALWICEICGETSSVQNKTVICKSCAEATHRCRVDGKILKSE